MKLLELILTATDERRFTILAKSEGLTDDLTTPSQLPFWGDEVDWRRTALRCVETNFTFDSAQFSKPGEQDWMLESQLLTPNGFAGDLQERLGQALYQALFPTGAPANALRDVWRKAREEETELHIRLKFAPNSNQCSRLADYPWELIHNGVQGFLLKQRRVTFSRWLAYDALPPSIEPVDLLRVWLISSTSGDESLNLPPLPNAEQQAVQRGLENAQASGEVALTVLPNAQLAQLECLLEERPEALWPQVVHFDGHGLYGQRCTNLDCLHLHNHTRLVHCPDCGQALPQPQGFLFFEDEQGGAEIVSADQLAQLLPNSVKLVVLSACQSGMATVGDSLFHGAAQRFIAQEFPAVVAMQYAVLAGAASQFSERFYRALGQHQSVAKAVAVGRQGMADLPNQWYRPVLYFRSPCSEGGKLFCEASLALTRSLEQLYQLLRKHQVILWSAINEAHQAVLPIAFEQPSNTLREKLDNLQQLPLQEKGELDAGVRFVDALLNSPSFPQQDCTELRQELQAWAVETEPSYAEVLQQRQVEAAQIVRPDVATQSTLILTVRKARQKRDQYEATACLMSDPNPLGLDEQLPYGKRLAEITDTPQKIADWVDDVISDCTKQPYEIALKRLAVECSLPWDLLHLALDIEWKISGAGRHKVALSSRCQSFTVRGLDRHLPDNYYSQSQPDWKEAWKHAQERADRPWQESFAKGSGAMPELIAELKQYGFVSGWLFDFPESEHDQDKLVDVMLGEGIPIALWLRPSELDDVDAGASTAESPPPNFWDTSLQNVPLWELPQAITAAREQGEIADNSEIRRLALMWDNPFRPVPEIAYSQPSDQRSLPKSQDPNQ